MWFAPLVEGFSDAHQYSEADRARFRNDPQPLVDHIKLLDGQLNAGWPAFLTGSEAQAMARRAIKSRMAELIQDERLLRGLWKTPLSSAELMMHQASRPALLWGVAE